MDFLGERASVELYGDGHGELKPRFNYLPWYDYGTRFIQEGRAVINYAEYEDFKKHVEEIQNEEIYLIYVDWDYLQERTLRDLCLKGLYTFENAPKKDLKYSKYAIANLAECHKMDSSVFENGLLVATNDESMAFKNIIANTSRLFEVKGLAEDNVDDSTNASMKTQPETHIMIFVDQHLIQRYFKTKVTILQAPRTKSSKRGILDSTFISEMKAEPKRSTQSYEIQLDEKLATMKRKTNGLRELMEEIASNGNNGHAEYLQSIDEKTQEIQQMCDRIEALTTLIQKEASTRIDTLARKIDTIEKTRDDIETTIYENEDEYSEKIVNMEGKIAELIQQLALARVNGETKQQTVSELENELRTKEDTLATWQVKITEFSDARNLEIQKLESLLDEKNEEISNSKTEIRTLKAKELQATKQRKEVTTIMKDAGVSPFKILQQSATKHLPTKKTPVRHGKPIKLEHMESDLDTSSDEEYFNTPVATPKSTKANLCTMDDSGKDGASSPNNDAGKKVSSSFTATPGKFGMKNWDPKECGLMEHLIRLDMGLQQSESKGCDVTTQQNLILMTLPAEYSYVNQYVSDSRDTMVNFKRKLVELIIGSSSEQTNELMLTQRKVGEHILMYFNRLINLYSFCANKSESDLESDAWGLRIIYQKTLAAMTAAAVMEMQRQTEDKVEQGTLKLSELKQAVIKAARKNGPQIQPYTPGISHVGSANMTQGAMMMQANPDFPFGHGTAAQPMAPQPVPTYMLNRYDRRDEHGNRKVDQARDSGYNDSGNRDSYSSNWKRDRNCFYCGIKGHVTADCRRRKADERNNGKNNSYNRNNNSKAENNREPKDEPEGRTDKRNNNRWKHKKE